MKGNFPWRLIETHDQVTFLFEEDNRVNIARFREQHAADVKPTWTGDSIARWQGDTLVIDTVAFNGKTPFPHGVFITTQLHLIHHFRLVAQGTQLEDRIKIDDPGAFTKSFEIVSTFNRVPGDYKLADYRCAENNQDMPENMPFWPVEWGPE